MIEYTDDGKKMKGVLEIKCLASDKWRSLSPDECCQDSDFYAELNSTTGHLKLNITINSITKCKDNWH